LPDVAQVGMHHPVHFFQPQLDVDTFVLPKVSLAVQLGFVTAFHFSMVLLGHQFIFKKT